MQIKTFYDTNHVPDIYKYFACWCSITNIIKTTLKLCYNLGPQSEMEIIPVRWYCHFHKVTNQAILKTRIRILIAVQTRFNVPRIQNSQLQCSANIFSEYKNTTFVKRILIIIRRGYKIYYKIKQYQFGSLTQSLSGFSIAVSA